MALVSFGYMQHLTVHSLIHESVPFPDCYFFLTDTEKMNVCLVGSWAKIPNGEDGLDMAQNIFLNRFVEIVKSETK